MDGAASPLDRASWPGSGPGAWAAPWFDAVRDAAERLPAPGGWPTVAQIDAALAPLAGVRFVVGEKRRARRRPGRPIAAGELYEVRIAERREVPTRAESAHDLLNALAWAAFPASKWRLASRLAEAQSARLAAEPARWRLPGWRSRMHDRLALLDEGGILVAAAPHADRGEPGLAAALATGAARALVFGHALLEHALAGRVDVWGAAILLPVDPAGPVALLRARLDEALAEALTRDGFLSDPEPWARLALGALAV